jgi:isochorismate synthase EntC
MKKQIVIFTAVQSVFMDFEGNFNHAIMIRTFLSKNHQLHSQAGAGIVAGFKRRKRNARGLQ